MNKASFGNARLSPVLRPRSFSAAFCKRGRARSRQGPAAVQHTQDQRTHVRQRQTYLGETFWQVQPKEQNQHVDYRQASSSQEAPAISLRSLNHAALEASDPKALSDFYHSVLGFEHVDRPDFPFGGAWLQGGGLLLHIIQEDPSVPKRLQHWKDKFAEQPQTWYIRRANHLAFEVEDAQAMEARLVFFGIEYTKAVVPDTDASQLFFYDPEGHGVEVGCDYAEVADMLRARLGKVTNNQAAAVSP